MKREEQEALLNRVRNVIDTMKNTKSGVDIHEACNILNTAGILKDDLEKSNMVPEDTAKRVVKNLESRTVEFFKKKYQHLNKK